MVRKPVPAQDADEDWGTAAVADFLGISRQAVHKRWRSGRLLGYRDGRTTRFPAWQFDAATGEERPVVADLLDVVGPDTDAAAVAHWLTSTPPGLGGTPLALLLSATTEATVLDLARDHDFSAPASSPRPRGESPLLRRARQQLESPDAEPDPRIAILLAATDLFARQGPAKVSLRAVADAAGVPYSLIYRFFGTKDNLVASVLGLLVEQGARYVQEEPDAYAAIGDAFGADAGQLGRMLAWATLDEVPPARLFPGELRTGAYRGHIERLWADPEPPEVRAHFDPRVLTSLIGLVSGAWDAYEPYLSALFGEEMPDTDAQRAEVIELLQLLAYVARPGRPDPSAGRASEIG